MHSGSASPESPTSEYRHLLDIRRSYKDLDHRFESINGTETLNRIEAHASSSVISLACSRGEARHSLWITVSILVVWSMQVHEMVAGQAATRKSNSKASILTIFKRSHWFKTRKQWRQNRSMRHSAVHDRLQGWVCRPCHCCRVIRQGSREWMQEPVIGAGET